MSEMTRSIWLPQADFAFLRQITLKRDDLSSTPLVIQALEETLPKLEEPEIRERIASYESPRWDHERSLKVIRLPMDLDRLVGQRARETQLERESIIIVSVQLFLEGMRVAA